MPDFFEAASEAGQLDAGFAFASAERLLSAVALMSVGTASVGLVAVLSWPQPDANKLASIVKPINVGFKVVSMVFTFDWRNDLAEFGGGP